MKREMKKITAVMLAGVLMVIPVGVSAEKGNNNNNSNKPGVEEKIKGNENAKGAQVEEQEDEISEEKYISFEGEVTEIADGRITVKENDNIIMFNLNTMIIATKDGEAFKAEDIKVGDKITAVYSSHTPMALSYPGQMTPMMIIVHNSDDNIKIDKFDKELVSSDGTLKLVVDDNTKLEHYKTKQIVTEKDLLNKNLLVIYGATTRSIPAQTLASDVVKVIILPEVETNRNGETTGPNSNSNVDNKGNKATAHSKVAIAKEAKNLGYKVNWNPKTKIVILTKDQDVIEIYVGTTRYRINGMEKTASTPANLEKGSTYVSDEILDYLKK